MLIHHLVAIGFGRITICYGELDAIWCMYNQARDKKTKQVTQGIELFIMFAFACRVALFVLVHGVEGLLHSRWKFTIILLIIVTVIDVSISFAFPKYYRITSVLR